MTFWLAAAMTSVKATPTAAPPPPSMELANNQTIRADDAYLARSITNPDAQVVSGYHAGLMAPAIASFDLAAKPSDIRALVAFIKSTK